jgi:hypothetical protein
LVIHRTVVTSWRLEDSPGFDMAKQIRKIRLASEELGIDFEGILETL